MADEAAESVCKSVKTAQTIEQLKAERDSGVEPKRRMHPNSLKNLVAPWRPGESPKSPGRPRDKGADLCRKVVENNEERIYEGLAAKAIAGDAYACSVIFDRGYGKLKQGIIHTGDEEGGPIRNSITVEFVKPDGK